jgi:hypothetical protein
MTAASYRGSSRVCRPFAEFPVSVSAAFRFSVECSRQRGDWSISALFVKLSLALARRLTYIKCS